MAIMGVKDIRITNQTATSITVAVDTDQADDYIKCAYRSTAYSDKTDVETDETDVEEVQVPQPTNTFTFNNLDVPETYYVAAIGYNDVVDPPTPPEPGTVPAPSNLSVQSTTATTISLAWDTFDNDGSGANLLDWELNGAMTRPRGWRAVAEFPYNPYTQSGGRTANNFDPAFWPTPSVEQDRGGGQNALKFDISWDASSPTGILQNRQELELMSDFDDVDSGDFYRIPYKTDFACGWSTYRPYTTGHSSYQNMGQVHDSRDNELVIDTFGISPIWSYNLEPNTEAIWSMYGRSYTKAECTDKAFTTAAAATPATDYAGETGRWMDFVIRFRFDPTGSNDWPADGAEPYTGFIEMWLDGELMCSASGVPLGNNDRQDRGHWFRIGLYCGWKEMARVAAMTGDPRVILYLQNYRIATGANATYENVAPGGRVHKIEVVEEINPNTFQVVKVLPPSARSATITVPNGSTHKYSIRAKYNNEISTGSNQVEVTAA